jgi:hypothetical protein
LLTIDLTGVQYAWVTTRRMKNCSSYQYVGMFSTKIVLMNGWQTIQPAQSVDLCPFPVAKWFQWNHQPRECCLPLALPGSFLFYMHLEAQVHQNLAWKGAAPCNLI